MKTPIDIIPCDPAIHWSGVWAFMQPVFEAGNTYPIAVDIAEKEAKSYWCSEDKTTFVAIDQNKIVLGTYYIRPNQPSLGAHICNCGYVVNEAARGQGIASMMCQHSQEFAIANGYRGMQYNLVVISNEGAIRLWKKHGLKLLELCQKALPIRNWVMSMPILCLNH